MREFGQHLLPGRKELSRLGLSLSLLFPNIAQAQQQNMLEFCNFHPEAVTLRLEGFNSNRVTRLRPDRSSEEVMETLSQLPARDIWLGYEQGGFDLPFDVEDVGTLRLRGGEFEERQEIWITYSESAGEYFLFPVDHMEPYGDENYGIHPCGAYAIPEESMETLEQLFTNDRQNH